MTRAGVVLMTYGSPRNLDDVRAYMTRVRDGREPSDELVEEFQRRYAAIEMSPLMRITQQLARELDIALNATGAEYRVAAGMRFSEPTIAQAVQALAHNGVDRILGVILSPQYSPMLMAAYPRAIEAAADAEQLPSRTVGAWHLNPAFVDVLASRIRGALAGFSDAARDNVPVLLTAHSLPKRVVDREPEYIDQLQATARAAADLAPGRWRFVYQSAGHTPEEWLKPDMLDVLPELAAEGHRQVVIAPVQFLADHLETLYDIDVAGRRQAEAAGFERFVRIDAPNAAPDFVAALATVVQGELAAWDTAEFGRGVRWVRV
jgi:ferrochelatase